MAITVLTGKPGEGKTWEMSNMAFQDLNDGIDIYINYALLSEKKEYYCRDCEDEMDDMEEIIEKYDTKNVYEELGKWKCKKHGQEHIFERYIPLTSDDYPNLHYWQDIQDWRKFKRGNIYIDEGQIFFNSRNWEQLPSEIQYKLQLHRHDGLNLILTTQNIKRIDVVVRELVQILYKMEKINILGVDSIFKMSLFRKLEIDTDTIEKEEKAIIKSKFLIANWRKIPLYDTLGKIPLPKIKGYARYFIKCHECGKERPLTGR